MLNQATLDKLHALRLSALAEAFQHQLSSPQHAELSFAERLGLLVDVEWEARQQRKLTQRLRNARLRYPASIEDLDYNSARGLDRQVVLALASCEWIRQRHHLLISGPTGTGKTFLACAFVERACRSGLSAVYVRASRLLQDLAVARGDGSYGRLLAKLAKLDLLAIDDWLLAPLKEQQRLDLLEVIEDRYQRSATLIATQLPVKSWHEAIGEATLADAICDRLIHGAHKIALKGPSLRELRAAKGKAKPGA
jgi:DNA replication protein DnaC